MRLTRALRLLRPPYGLRTGLSNLIAAALLVLAAAGARAEPVTVAALGDSLTAGYGLPQDRGFVPQLQEWLRANGAPDAIVINAGVSGDTSAGGLARVDWTLTEDVDAVILELGGNDMLRGLDPSLTRANLDGILARIGARGLPVLLTGLRAPGNYGPEYRQAFDGMFPELAERHQALLYPSFLEGILRGRTPAQARALIQADGIHPNAEGVEAIVADIGPKVLELIRAAGG